MLVSVIIVSYNTADLLRDCLASLYDDIHSSELKRQIEVIVIDNASSDESVRMVQKSFPSVTLIRNKKNLGFAAANNQGIGLSKGKFVMLLNSDTIVKKGAIDLLGKAIEQDSSIGVVGPKLLNHDQTLQYSLGFFPNLPAVFGWMLFLDDIVPSFFHPYHIESPAFYRTAQDIDWVTAACMIVKKEAIARSGLLDEKIFMYGEEVEWCYRIRRAGFRIRYLPDAQVIHLKGGSAAHQSSAGITEEFSSLLHFYRLHKPSWQLPVLRIILQCGILLRIAVFGIIGKHQSRRSSYAKALQMVR